MTITDASDLDDLDHPLSALQRSLKRTFDLLAAAGGLLVLSPVIILVCIGATIDTRQNGFFTHERVGQFGERFKVIKFRSMRDDLAEDVDTHVTAHDDPRITRFGRFLRDTNLDELPQLFNIVKGEMSFVGPRPEVPGFADELTGEDRKILMVRPGMTGPSTLNFLDEEELLLQTDDPESFNREVLYPTKVKINRRYVEDYSLVNDLRYILYSIRGKPMDIIDVTSYTDKY